MWLAVRTACVASLALSFLPAALVRASFADPPPPPVLSPKSGDVWTVGEVMTVRWSMDDIPFFEGDNKTPFPGTIYLGHLTDSDAGFALWSQEPLADNVPLLNKEVAVEVPNVPSGRNYFIMLNKPTNQGGIFTIVNPKDPKGTGAAPSSISVFTFPVTTASFMLPSTLSALTSSTSEGVSGNASIPTSGSGAPSTSSTASSSDATTSSSSSSSATIEAPASPTSGGSASSTAPSASAPSSTSTSTPNGVIQPRAGGLVLVLSMIALLHVGLG